MEGDRDMYRQFQDWCLRTYGDSGKTKTVTRKKYDRIVQLLNGSESSSTDNAKFKFWVKSKGFQLGVPDEISGGEKQVLYVPVKTTEGVGIDEKVSLRQVAVVEDFFDIIYAMHVENGTNGEKTRKHAGQKRTYKAPRVDGEVVPGLGGLPWCRFGVAPGWLRPSQLLCHTPSTALLSVGSDSVPPVAVATATWWRTTVAAPHCFADDSLQVFVFAVAAFCRPPPGLLGEAFVLALAAMLPLAPDILGEQSSPPGEDYAPTNPNGISSCSAGSFLNCTVPLARDAHRQRYYNGGLYFVEQNGKPPTLVTSMIDYNMPITMAYMKHMKLQLLNSQNDEEDSSLDSDEFDMGDSTRMSAVNSDLSSNLEERMSSPQNLHNQQDGKKGKCFINMALQYVFSKSLGKPSPAHSFSSYDSGKNESVGGGVEDLSLSRGDEDEDEHDDQEDSEKAMEAEGVETERLKAFNMFVRLFVDENLDRMVPISKQPKEKIQAIIESCRRQFPEYQERARKRIRTYLKSCRRMKRNDFDASRPIPSHLTSAAAENILASACESESRNAAKRMRLDRPQDEAVSTDKQYKQEPVQVTFPVSAVPTAQEVLYINGNGTYSCHSYSGLGGGLLNLTEASSSEHSVVEDEAVSTDKQYKQEPVQVTFPVSAVPTAQEVLYINGNGTYSCHSYSGLGGGLLNLTEASSSGLINSVMKTDILPIVLSDQSPVLCNFTPISKALHATGGVSIPCKMQSS
ncbi:Nucleolar protein 4 [Acipenser ruthenus]|uniref:Nucleolar protein 4 n=1 Tax=Acipenser ruthenus TaxID=7906 RepID=A0A444UM46_ACIRT|nr:Nucleolar protein 4 [Acipenser ruthenus]